MHKSTLQQVSTLRPSGFALSFHLLPFGPRLAVHEEPLPAAVRFYAHGEDTGRLGKLLRGGVAGVLRAEDEGWSDLIVSEGSGLTA